MPNGYQCLNRVSKPLGSKLFRVFGFGLVVLTVAGCSTVSLKDNAPIEDRSNSTVSTAVSTSNNTNSSNAYTVQKGDTLRSIATKYNTDWREIARLNNMSEPYPIKVGQVLMVPGNNRITDSPSDSTTAPGVEVMPIGGDNSTSAPPKDTSPKAVDTGPNALKWIWPYSGEIINGFGDRNKGVDIAGTVGDKVVAAAAGKVLFSGNDVPGYGNLIIIMHNDSYMSTYAHNSKLLVKKDETVTQGQAIAEIGQSDTSSPRLHFEIRKSGVSAADPKLFAPVDPMPYLPKK